MVGRLTSGLMSRRRRTLRQTFSSKRRMLVRRVESGR